MKQLFCVMAWLCLLLSTTFANNTGNCSTPVCTTTGLRLPALLPAPFLKSNTVTRCNIPALTAYHIVTPINTTAMITPQQNQRRFDPNSSLAMLAGNPASSTLKTSFTLTGYLPEFTTVTGYSEKYGSIKHYAINSPLLALYATALPVITSLSPNKILWNVQNSQAFAPAHEPGSEAGTTHLYCMECTAPSALADELPAMIKTMLDSYFGLTTAFEQKDMPCLVLSAGKRFRPIARPTKLLVNTLEEPGATKQLYGSCQQLCDVLNRQLDTPVVNDIGGELLDITFPDEPLSPESLKAWLFLYGIELKPSVQSIPVFTISNTR